MASALAVLLLLPAAATALMYDVVDRAKLPPAECTAGCAHWTHLIEDGAASGAAADEGRLVGISLRGPEDLALESVDDRRAVGGRQAAGRNWQRVCQPGSNLPGGMAAVPARSARH